MAGPSKLISAVSGGAAGEIFESPVRQLHPRRSLHVLYWLSESPNQDTLTHKYKIHAQLFENIISDSSNLWPWKTIQYGFIVDSDASQNEYEHEYEYHYTVHGPWLVTTTETFDQGL